MTADPCTGLCEMHWERVHDAETDMVCAACAWRSQVPPAMCASLDADDGWELWRERAQETFRRKAAAR